MSLSTASDGRLRDRLDRLFASYPAAMAEARTIYRDLREAGPVHRHGPVVLVTRYRDCRATYRDADRFSSTANRAGRLASEARARLTGEQRAALDHLNHLETMRMTKTDGEVHARLRRIAQRAFSPASIRRLQDKIDLYVAELLDQAGGQFDLATFAYELPLRVIADLLGVPQGDLDEVHRWSMTIGANRGGTNPALLMPAYTATEEFSAYVRRLNARHRGRKQVTPLVDALMEAEGGDRMTEDEVVVTFMMLLFAGHETTASLIGSGTYELLRDRTTWQEMVEDRSIVPGVVEELLRIVSPVQWDQRVATEDVEVAGERVTAGQTVRIMTASANLDPDVFPEPETIDVTRPNGREHLAFGHGPHFCLGSALARLEATTVLGAFAEQLPTLRLAASTLRWTGGAHLRRLAEIPVTVTV